MKGAIANKTISSYVWLLVLSDNAKDYKFWNRRRKENPIKGGSKDLKSILTFTS